MPHSKGKPTTIPQPSITNLGSPCKGSAISYFLNASIYENHKKLNISLTNLHPTLTTLQWPGVVLTSGATYMACTRVCRKQTLVVFGGHCNPLDHWILSRVFAGDEAGTLALFPRSLYLHQSSSFCPNRPHATSNRPTAGVQKEVRSSAQIWDPDQSHPCVASLDKAGDFSTSFRPKTIPGLSTKTLYKCKIIVQWCTMSRKNNTSSFKQWTQSTWKIDCALPSCSGLSVGPPFLSQSEPSKIAIHCPQRPNQLLSYSNQTIIASMCHNNMSYDSDYDPPTIRDVLICHIYQRKFRGRNFRVTDF